MSWISLGISLIFLILSVGGSTAVILARIAVLEAQMKGLKETVDQHRTQFVPRTECDILHKAKEEHDKLILARLVRLETQVGI